VLAVQQDDATTAQPFPTLEVQHDAAVPTAPIVLQADEDSIIIGMGMNSDPVPAPIEGDHILELDEFQLAGELDIDALDGTDQDHGDLGLDRLCDSHREMRPSNATVVGKQRSVHFTAARAHDTCAVT
jgi:hypothetical protein